MAFAANLVKTLKKISLLHKELLGKDKFIKSLLETQTAILTHYQVQH